MMLDGVGTTPLQFVIRISGFEAGEIVISPEQARRQARRARRRLVDEVAFLAAHGMLHLLGFEDETPRGYREMVRLGHDAARQKSVKR